MMEIIFVSWYQFHQYLMASLFAQFVIWSFSIITVCVNTWKLNKKVRTMLVKLRIGWQKFTCATYCKIQFVSICYFPLSWVQIGKKSKNFLKKLCFVFLWLKLFVCFSFLQEWLNKVLLCRWQLLGSETMVTLKASSGCAEKETKSWREKIQVCLICSNQWFLTSCIRSNTLGVTHYNCSTFRN